LIKFVSDLRQVGSFLRYNWNIVAVKHHHPSFVPIPVVSTVYSSPAVCVASVMKYSFSKVGVQHKLHIMRHGANNYMLKILNQSSLWKILF
jgi:hypothetical protein